MSIHHLPSAVSKPSGHTTTIVAQDQRARPCMALVPGSGLGFTDEIHDLLRRRLRIVSLILLIGSALFLGRSFLAPVDGLGSVELAIHFVVVLALAGCSVILWSRKCLCLFQLRSLELVIFGTLAIFFAYLQYRDFHRGTFLEDVGPAQHERIFNFAVITIAQRWFSLIVIYGAFIPNTWRRCLSVVAGIAAIPMFLMFWVCFRCPVMGEFWPTAVFDMFVILGIGSATAIFGSHRINELQQKAFEAKKFGQYRLLRKLGSGGMGDVYLGEHMLLRRACAIKTIRPENTRDPLSLSRFEREVQAMATLTHWNTVEIYDYGNADDGTFFYVMEYLPGMTLHEMVERYGPLPAGRAIHFLRQVCAALKEAHGIGLIHRDIKPSNVLVCTRGCVADVAKLLDFGLVQDISPRHAGEADRLTMQGAILGSPPFISPEQARGNQPVDERTDIYSFGGLAYFLVTGVAPFERDSALEMLAAHLHETPKAPRLLNPEVPVDLEDVIMRCLQKKPADRYQDISEVDHALSLCETSEDWTDDDATTWWKDRKPAAAVDAREAALVG